MGKDQINKDIARWIASQTEMKFIGFQANNLRIFTGYLNNGDHKSENLPNEELCMLPIYSCDGWEITTIEGLGNKHKGYHSIQKRLADYNGTQCGYCSPGFVMNMYGILANDPKPTQQKIENSFDGNICRCTGYRPILDAMKSFATNDSEVPDIEDVNKACCGKKGYVVCNNSCKEIKEATGDYVLVPSGPTKNLKHTDGEWHKPETMKDCLTLLKETENKKVRLVVGNTGTGVFKNDGPYDHYIDIKNIPELHKITSNQSELVFGSTITLSELIEMFKKKSEKSNVEDKSSAIWSYFSGSEDSTEGWEYCAALAHHISYIANTPVRNAGCWAGNLKMKHDHNEFPSDMFTIMETAGATLTIGNNDGTLVQDIKPSDFFKMEMKGKILTKLTLKRRTSNHIMRTFKITIRSQNSHAYINAGFMFEISKSENFKVKSKPNIVFGGVKADFVHATETEKLLTGAELGNAETVEKALKALETEIVPDSSDPVSSSAAYRKSLCVSLLYKFILGVLGNNASPEYQSGGPNMDRPLSGGERNYYTDETVWPLTKPVQKLEAMIQCSGEAEYAGDFESLKDQLYAAFVLSSEANAKIDSIDSKAAMVSAVSGVSKVLTAKDIPGMNDFAHATPFFFQKEELLASTRVKYNGQPIAIILADTEYIAEKAAKLVKVKYSDIKEPILDIRQAIKKKSFWKLPSDSPVVAGNVEDGFKESDKVIEGEIGTGAQYHFHMETQTAYCVPTDMGLDVYSATQMVNHCQGAIADIIGIKKNEINMIVKRLGGAYGAKPVLMHLPLETNMRVIGKRLPYLAKYKVGVTNDGKFKAIQIDYYDDSGAGANEQTGSTVLLFGDSAYFCDNWKLQAFCVKTDTPQNCSCRAPAWLQAVTFMDEICENVAFHMGKEPIDIKTMNFIENGQKKANGSIILNCLISGMVKEFKTMSNFEDRRIKIIDYNKNNRWKKKGLATCMMRFPHFYFALKFNAAISIYASDGTVAISHGGIEMGQGINTKAAQVCAYEFGIPLSMIRIKATSSIINPNQTLTGGSIGSDLVAYAVSNVCKGLKLRMASIKKKMKDPTWIELVKECEKNNMDLSARNTLKKANGSIILNCLISGMVKEFKTMSNFEDRRIKIIDYNKNNRWKKKGLATCMMRFPHFYFALKFNAAISIYASDGTVAISHGGIEMGQGINTKAAQVCAYEFGIPLSMIRIKATSSIINPNQTLTGGSIGSDLVAYAVSNVCKGLKLRMASIKKKMKDPTWIELVKECEKNNMDLSARNTYSPKDVPGSYDIYGMTAAEIELDVLTGMVQIPRVDILYDCGDSISPDVDIGQIEGAFVMGLGLMMSEQMKYDSKSGELLTKNTWEYKPPTTKDIPIKFNIKFLKNSRNPLGVLGSKATGEPALCMSSSVLFAVRDAIQSATEDIGLTERVTINAPATPELNHLKCLVSTDRMKI
ncbi:Xanthine dehydrogenase [Nymphon striatum]|nr:Xanthine dehydrogenase [Nymphon striatum]